MFLFHLANHFLGFLIDVLLTCCSPAQSAAKVDELPFSGPCCLCENLLLLLYWHYAAMVC